jgi:hypothetical protein
LIGGLFLGILLGFLRNSFDESIRSEKELERLLGLPVIGTVSKMTLKNSRKYTTKRFLFFHFFEGIFSFKNKSYKNQKQQEHVVRDVDHPEGLAKAHNEG